MGLPGAICIGPAEGNPLCVFLLNDHPVDV